MTSLLLPLFLTFFFAIVSALQLQRLRRLVTEEMIAFSDFDYEEAHPASQIPRETRLPYISFSRP